MSGNSVLDMAQALKVKSQEKALLIEKAALNAFHEQEQVLGKALEESTTTIDGWACKLVKRGNHGLPIFSLFLRLFILPNSGRTPLLSKGAGPERESFSEERAASERIEKVKG